MEIFLFSDTPFGQLPIYQEDDKIIWQSHAICRYIAKKVKLTGENDWEDLEIDAIIDTIRDLTQSNSVISYKIDYRCLHILCRLFRGR